VRIDFDPEWRGVRQLGARGFSEVDPENLKSVIYYDELPEHFTERAKKLFPVVKKFFPRLSLKDWINDFKYDPYPERELAKWENAVKQYLDKTRGKKVPPKMIKVIAARILIRMSKKKHIEYLLRKWI
jgi:hypothetical protein